MTRPDVFKRDQKQTRFGMIDFADPRPEQIDFYDIAHALSLICRFGGACRRFYSVAEHSINVSRLLEPFGLAREGLLHDAAEAYLGDMPTPLKRLFPEFSKLEDRLMEIIAGVFGLDWPFPELVKEADRYMLEREAEALMTRGIEGWGLAPTDLDRWDENRVRVYGFEPGQAVRHEFCAQARRVDLDWVGR